MAALEELAARLRARVKEATELAIASASVEVGGAPAEGPWDVYLLSLGVKPLPLEDRLAAIANAAAGHKGALPLELRLALEAIRAATKREWRALAPDAGPEDPFRTELDGFVDREIKAYLVKAKPAPMLAGIFANAARTTVRYDEAKDGVKTKKCPCCGAARPEGSDMRVCSFCGQDLF